MTGWSVAPTFPWQSTTTESIQHLDRFHGRQPLDDCRFPPGGVLRRRERLSSDPRHLHLVQQETDAEVCADAFHLLGNERGVDAGLGSVQW